MQYVSAADAKRRLADVLDRAQQGPVVIRGEGCDVAVVLSVAEYDRLRGTNVAEFQRLCDDIAERAAARGMTADKLAEILADEQ